MRIGLLYDFSNPPQWVRPQAAAHRRQLEQIKWAEEIGIDDIWLTEHHFWEDGYLPSPVIAAGAVAACTSRVRIGTSVLVGPLYHPVRLAEDLAFVDALSDGRLEVGIGLGWAGLEYQTFGVDVKRRVSLLREVIDVLRLAWTTDEFVYKGRHFDFGPLTVTPRPVQSPHPRIWAGVRTRAGGRRAGRWGLPLLWMEPPVVDAYIEGRTEAGLPCDELEIGGFLFLFVCDDPDREWSRIFPHARYQLARYGAAGRDVAASMGTEVVDRHELRRRFGQLVLTPDEAVQELRTRSMGRKIENVHCFASLPGIPSDLSDRHVELLATVVRPAIANDAWAEQVERSPSTHPARARTGDTPEPR